MAWEIITFAGIAIIGTAITLILWQKRSQAGLAGNLYERWFMPPPRYYNKQKGTCGRAAGTRWLEKGGENYCNIRYRTGMFFGGIKVDTNIPIWAVMEKHPPQVQVPEGIVEVIPYTYQSATSETEKYIIVAGQSNRKAKILENQVRILEENIKTGISTTIALENIENMKKLISGIVKTTDTGKEKYTIETKPEEKTRTTTTH